MKTFPIRFMDGDPTKPLNCEHQERLFCDPCIAAMISKAGRDSQRFSQRKEAESTAIELYKATLHRIATDRTLDREKCADMATYALIEGSDNLLGA